LTNSNLEVKIFPNPIIGSFNLQIDNDIKNGEIILINSIGQKVFEKAISKGVNFVDINESLGKGLYNYLLLENNQKLISGKLVIE
jgi:hypothetical protein